jgi:hypothetical protein
MMERLSDLRRQVQEAVIVCEHKEGSRLVHLKCALEDLIHLILLKILIREPACSWPSRPQTLLASIIGCGSQCVTS